MRNSGCVFRLSVALTALLAAACLGNAESAAHHNFTLVGSTPCDAAIKAALGVPTETKCDFIRWNIAMDPTNGNSFKLDANYGEAQPNTLGFVAGGLRVSAAGRFEISSTGRREIYRLTSELPTIDVSLVKVNSNLFHLLVTDGSMMLGSDGWSYTLNRSVPIATAPMPTVSFAAAAEQARAPQTIFVGRTPCKEIMELTGMVYEAECFKLKWKLTLNRDAATRQPTTFMIESTVAREKPIAGKWSTVKSGEATIYSLTPDASMKPFSLMLAEDNLLFFLNTGGRPLVGNKDFSFTLNRRQ